MLPKVRKKEISELAEFIADYYCPQGIVNPEIIAESKGISYSYGEYENDFDGMIEHLNGKFHIYILPPAWARILGRHFGRVLFGLSV